MRQCARRTGVPVSVINAYENGRREPGTRVFRELLHACGADLTLTDRWDSARNGRHFEAVMEMTDHLPKGVRGDLRFPPFGRAAQR